MSGKRGLFITGILLLIFGAFAGVAFVQSAQDVGAPEEAKAKAVGSGCPFSGKTKEIQASGMPKSCSDMHKQARVDGKLAEADDDRAEMQLAAVIEGTSEMTPERCREILAGLGHECNEKDLLACAKKIQSLGFCNDMTAEACAARLAKGICADEDPALCNKLRAQGLCCVTAAAAKAKADASLPPCMIPAAANENADAGSKVKQCDWTKGKCEPKKQPASDD
jgi:hypothetical protein